SNAAAMATMCRWQKHASCSFVNIWCVVWPCVTSAEHGPCGNVKGVCVCVCVVLLWWCSGGCGGVSVCVCVCVCVCVEPRPCTCKTRKEQMNLQTRPLPWNTANVRGLYIDRSLQRRREVE